MMPRGGQGGPNVFSIVRIFRHNVVGRPWSLAHGIRSAVIRRAQVDAINRDMLENVIEVRV